MYVQTRTYCRDDESAEQILPSRRLDGGLWTYFKGPARIIYFIGAYGPFLFGIDLAPVNKRVEFGLKSAA